MADDGELLDSLMTEGYPARGEQVIRVYVTAWGVNCPPHIPQRFDAADVERAIARNGRLGAYLSECRVSVVRKTGLILPTPQRVDDLLFTESAVLHEPSILSIGELAFKTTQFSGGTSSLPKCLVANWGNHTDADRNRPESNMEQALRDYLAARVPNEFSPTELDPDAEARLRALGYVEPDVVGIRDRKDRVGLCVPRIRPRATNPHARAEARAPLSLPRKRLSLDIQT